MSFVRSAYIAFALLLLSLGGCSMVTVGYNHADWILRYWINDYTSFNEQQREEIRRDVDDYLRWHRRNALPEYIAFLKEVDAMAGRTVDTADVARLNAEMDRLYRLTVTPTVRPAAHILSTLDSMQIEELRVTLANKNRELREELLSGSEDEMLVRRAKNQIRFVERLVGSLSSEQEDRIREMSLRLPFATRDYLDQRESKQARLISLLKDRAAEDQLAELFTSWVDEPHSRASFQEQQKLTAYDSAMNEMVVGIFRMLTTEQKEHLHHKLADYIEDLQALHSAVDTSAPAEATTR